MPNWDLSNWDSTFVMLVIAGTILFMWVLPAAAFWLFRLLNKKGGERDPDEFGPSASDGLQRL